MPYIGRFAPSPTGPLHLGSLYTAVASYLDAKANNGQWLVRIDDLDPPREQPGASVHILKTLESYGLMWDGEVIYQSQRSDAYEQTLETLWSSEDLFHCVCSRKQLQGLDVYPGTCRNNKQPSSNPSAIRIKTSNRNISFQDGIQGLQQINLSKDIGDFILKRKDNLYAYQLAVVVDDAHQNINHIVRGIDLMDSTPRQIWVQQCLGLAEQRYYHLPVIVNEQGQKLSKQTYAKDVLAGDLQQNLFWVLQHLNVAPMEMGTIPEMLNEAQSKWQIDSLTNQQQILEG